MILAQRASLLGELGKLRKNVALTEDQFKYVKMLILKDDPSVTMELLSTLRTFWEQRAEGILTDSEYNDQIIEAFGLMHSGDAHAVADYPEPLVVDLHSSKRKRSERLIQRHGSEDALIGEARLNNGGGASGSGGGSAAHYNIREVISVCGSDDVGLESDITVPQAEPIAGHFDDNSQTQSDNGCRGGVSDNDSGRGVANGGDGDNDIIPTKGSVEVDGKSHGTDEGDGIWKFVRSQRWLVTEDFKVPGKLFCSEPNLVRIVDSTVDLLNSSHEKPFPKITRGHTFGLDNTQRFHRQRKMYVMLKKVMICKGPNGEQCVFRATPTEIVDSLVALWGRDLDTDFSVDDYYREIIRKRS